MTSILNYQQCATIDLLDHCLSNYFQFGSRFYQQIKGTPMGSPISGFLAEEAQQRLERVVFAVISPKSWKRYVDGTFVIIKQNNLSAFHQLLSTTLPGVRFTVETATENKSPLLDVLLHKLPSGTFKEPYATTTRPPVYPLSPMFMFA